MRNLPFLLTLLWVAVACSTTREIPQVQDKTIVFLDSDVFDQQLSRALDSGARSVQIATVANDLSVNHFPQRLGRWLTAITERDGEIRYDPEPQVKGKFFEMAAGFLATAIPAAYDYLREQQLYAPSGGYDAVIHYVPASGAIEYVDFVRREKR